MKSKRQAQREQRQRKKTFTRLGLLVAGLAVLGLIAYALYTNRDTLAAAEVGQKVAEMSDIGHVEDGTDPGPFSTDPPTSGPHYASEYTAGFYAPGDKQDPYPAGYLVHNLEHGYVITWYNCDLLSAEACTELTSQIKQVLAAESNKTIAFPWPSLSNPVVMTSWGRILEFDEYDPILARDFIRANRNKAPEPNAP